jgi:hypothetical protein
MSEPTIDPSILGKALDWMWAGVVGLVGIIYKVNEKKHESAAEMMKKMDEKIDHEVRCARIEIKAKADSTDLKEAIANLRETTVELFKNAEVDRRTTRDLMTDIDRRAQDTIRMSQVEIMKAIANIGNHH